MRQARQAVEDQWSHAVAGKMSPVAFPTVSTRHDDDSSPLQEFAEEIDAIVGLVPRGLKTPHLQKTLCGLRGRTTLHAVEAKAVQPNSARKTQQSASPRSLAQIDPSF